MTIGRPPARLGGLLNLKRWPTRYAVIASLACGVITVLNQTTFGLPPIWKTSLVWALGLFAFLVIGPTLGPKFQAALHISPEAATAISVVLMAAMLITQQDAALPYRAIIIGVIQVAGGLGFAPAYVPTID